MSHYSRAVSVLLSIILFSVSVIGQKPATPETSSKDEEIREKAFKLLGAVSAQLSTLQSAQNRARIEGNLAALLWEHDEQRARQILNDAAEDLRILSTRPEESFDDYQTFEIVLNLRSNIVNRMAKHDPEVALRFLKSTRPVFKKSTDESYVTRRLEAVEQSTELQLAAEVVAKDPQLALKLAYETLDKGLSPALIGTVRQLSRKDKTASNELYRAMVAKLKQVNLMQDFSNMQIAIGLVSSVPASAFDERDLKDLLGKILNDATDAHCGPASGTPSEAEDRGYYCNQLGTILPLLKKYYPAQVAGWNLPVWRDSTVDSFEWSELSAVFEQGSVDDILALEADHPNMHEQLIMVAREVAVRNGDFSRARELIGKVTDGDARAEYLREIDQAEQRRTKQGANLEEALNALKSPEERLSFLITSIANPNTDRKTALALCDRALQLVDGLKPGRMQIFGWVKLAQFYAGLKSNRGFAIMEGLVPKLNGMVSAAAVLDGMDERKYFDDGEWSMTGEGSLGYLLTDLAQNAGTFAWLDFDRAANLAGQFERPEVRLMAQLKVAQAVLEGRGKGPLGLYIDR